MGNRAPAFCAAVGTPGCVDGVSVPRLRSVALHSSTRVGGAPVRRVALPVLPDEDLELGEPDTHLLCPTWPHSRAWGYAPSGGIRGSVIFRRWHLLKCTGRNDKQLESHGVHY